MVDSPRKILIPCVTHNFNVQGMHYPSGENRRQIAMAAVLLALTACGGGGGEAPPPALQPTLASIQANIFTPTCAKSGCHGAGSAMNGLSLEAGQSYAYLINVPSPYGVSVIRVMPGDPDNSFLIQKLGSFPPFGDRMPLNGPYYQQVTIDVIREWIQNGAPQ